MPEGRRGAASGEIIVTDGDRVERMYGVADGDTAWIFHDGLVYRIAGADGPRTASHAHGSLSAPMPATVVAVNVAPGDAVEAGAILILLEAMKMELPVRAPGDGRVKAVHCRPGELVQPDVVLIEFE
jgi:3-methylcrotonyl-CoA carboxylase alpha subunit